MSKEMTVKVIKGPHFEHVEKLAYGYLHKVLLETATVHEKQENDKEKNK